MTRDTWGPIYSDPFRRLLVSSRRGSRQLLNLQKMLVACLLGQSLRMRQLLHIALRGQDQVLASIAMVCNFLEQTSGNDFIPELASFPPVP